MTELREVLSFIASEATEGDIRSIYEIAKNRTRTLRTQQAALVAATVKPGDQVRLSGLSPKYLNGEIAEVITVGGLKVQVKFADYVGRYPPGMPFRVPACCLTVI